LTGQADAGRGRGLRPTVARVAAAVLTVSGSVALSKAFALGKASIVAPLVTSYGVVTTLLSWAGGEQISLLQLLCIALCVIGVVLSSMHSDPKVPHSTQASSSIAYALLAAVFYGTSFWLQGRFVLPVLGPVTDLWPAYPVRFIGLGGHVPRID